MKVDNKFEEVFFEMVLFYIHLVDRLAAQYLGVKQRDTIIDVHFLVISDQISRSYGTQMSTLADALNKRQIEYGKYKKLVPKKNEAMGGTLFWDFGEKIASILGSEMNALIIMLVQITISMRMAFLREAIAGLKKVK